MNRKAFICKAGIIAAGTLLHFNKVSAKGTTGGATVIWEELLDYARWCPSPHNVQPWKLKPVSGTEAHLYYDPLRVPGVVDDTTSFTIVGMGMFIECLNIAAQPKGYKVVAAHEPEPRLKAGGRDLKLFATLHLVPTAAGNHPDRELIKKRRTSRLHYDGGPIPAESIHGFTVAATSYGHRFVHTSDRELIDAIVRLNSNTVLERSDDKPTMDEMRQWIRTTDKEAAEKKDGLWYKGSGTSGKMMQHFFYHHERFDHGWKKAETRRLLNRSMKGTKDMAWISGPFDNRADWVHAGTMLQRLWLEMTRQGIYMHPLGTVITTPSAKEQFCKMTGEDERKDNLWFLVRMGHSKEPPRSYRLDVQDILVR